jgi:bacterioferritin-associated ferredoxin
VIVCSCNVLSDAQIRSMPRDPDGLRPCSPARAYRGLGCEPRCGRCAPTIRALLAEADVAYREAACRDCPAEGANLAAAGEQEPEIYLLAAE